MSSAAANINAYLALNTHRGEMMNTAVAKVVTTSSFEDLYAQLRANAKGMYPLEAATELLIRSDTWLRRGGFLQACVQTWGPTEAEPHLRAGACVMWDVVGEALAAMESVDEDCPEWLGASSGGQRRLILIAHDIAVGPMSDVCGLDRSLQELVLAAVAHAGGSHEHHPAPLTHHPDGTVTMAANRREYLGSLYPWPDQETIQP